VFRLKIAPFKNYKSTFIVFLPHGKDIREYDQKDIEPIWSGSYFLKSEKFFYSTTEGCTKDQEYLNQITPDGVYYYLLRRGYLEGDVGQDGNVEKSTDDYLFKTNRY